MTTRIINRVVFHGNYDVCWLKTTVALNKRQQHILWMCCFNCVQNEGKKGNCPIRKSNAEFLFMAIDNLDYLELIFNAKISCCSEGKTLLSSLPAMEENGANFKIKTGR